MRRIDKLGRIVIPLELREKYNLTEGASVEFLDSGDGVTVKSSDPYCKLCRSRISKNARLPLCDLCIQTVLENATK